MSAARLPLYRLATALAALALLVRLAVPAGFMPMAGSPALILCPGQTAMPAAMAGMHHDKTTHDDKSAQQSCPFAAAAAATDLATAPLILALPPMPLPMALLRTLLAAPGLGLAAPPPPKTGPPSLD